jgi:hypothetical protein
VSYDKCWKFTGTLDIRRLRKIVLPYNQDSKLHINFAKFFVRNASVLESMRLELPFGNFIGNGDWIKKDSIGCSRLKRGLRGVQDLILYPMLISHLGLCLSLRSKYMISQYSIPFKGFFISILGLITNRIYLVSM